MSRPSAGPRPRRRRCRRRRSATSPQAAARRGRRRRTGRRYVCRACNAPRPARPAFLRRPTVACRNEPGGSATCAAPIEITGGVRISTSSPWRVSRASRCCSAMRDSVVIKADRQRAGAAHIDVEPAVGCGDLDVERLADRDQRLGDGPGRLDRAVQTGVEDRAAVDRDDVVRTCRRIADLEHVVRAHPRVQGDAPAAGAMGIDQRRHLAIDSRLRQHRRPRARASRRGRARRPNAGSRSRRRRRNADRTARSAPRLRPRP